MNTACEGCPNKHNESDNKSNAGRKKDCKCQPGDKIAVTNPGLDQATAVPGKKKSYADVHLRALKK